MRPLGPALWWVPGTGGDADAGNRGRTDHLLVLRHAGRVWLMGSGATPAAGRALACVLRQRLGWRVSDVVNPWARPELVLGNQAFVAGRPAARLWAHADVAGAMRRQCPRCVERLHQRLGAAAVDVGPAPIVLPTRWLQGEHGRLGPWHWWRLERAPGSVVTLWHLPAQRLWWAPGLLWADGPPDLRDTTAPALDAALAQAQTHAAQAPGAQPGDVASREPTRWLPTQGPLLGPEALGLHRRYLATLQAAVQARQTAGALETDAPTPWPELPAWLQQGERAGLNWQRVWRQLENEAWAPTDPAGAAPAASR